MIQWKHKEGWLHSHQWGCPSFRFHWWCSSTGSRAWSIFYYSRHHFEDDYTRFYKGQASAVCICGLFFLVHYAHVRMMWTNLVPDLTSSSVFMVEGSDLERVHFMAHQLLCLYFIEFSSQRMVNNFAYKCTGVDSDGSYALLLHRVVIFSN